MFSSTLSQVFLCVVSATLTFAAPSKDGLFGTIMSSTHATSIKQVPGFITFPTTRPEADSVCSICHDCAHAGHSFVENVGSVENGMVWQAQHDGGHFGVKLDRHTEGHYSLSVVNSLKDKSQQYFEIITSTVDDATQTVHNVTTWTKVQAGTTCIQLNQARLEKEWPHYLESVSVYSECT